MCLEGGKNAQLRSKTASSSISVLVVTTRTTALRGYYGHYAVTTRSLGSRCSHFAVIHDSKSGLGHFAVTSVTMQALRGHKINDPERSGRGHFGHDAVTSRNSYFAVTTRLLRGHNAVTTVTTRSLRLLRSHYGHCGQKAHVRG